ncbi:MAG TPA: energy-coupling factor transporter transmembrane component T [Thermomicrobiaceae bacterium]|nr:energy-coupling factor transporter transmembrane component T [Thermomicrobiaceae bacterium]
MDIGGLTGLSAPGSAVDRSWAWKIDPRVKLLFTVLATVLLLLWNNIYFFVAALLLVQLALWASGFSWRRIGAVWKMLLAFLVLIVILWPIFNRGGTPVLLHAGPLIITGQAILAGCVAAGRIISITFIFVLWLGTTGQRELVRGFVRLGLPFSLGMAVTIGLRFIPTFAGVFETVSQAQRSRGLILPSRGVRWAKAMIPILVAALVTALRMSEQLGWTLEARGFGAPVRRTVLHELEMRPIDWLLLGIVVVALGGLLYLALFAGVGRGLT